MLLTATFALCAFMGCSSSKTAGGAMDPAKQYDTVTLMTGLRYIDFERGDGKELTAGMKVSVNYAGYLANGTLFDTSLDSIGRLHDVNGRPFPPTASADQRKHRFDRGGYPFQPLSFVLGKGDVIRGWDEGLAADMYVGGRRRLIIPPDLGYGSAGTQGIPANSTLIFDITPVSAQ